MPKNIKKKDHSFSIEDNSIIKTIKNIDFFLSSSLVQENLNDGIDLVMGRFITDPSGPMHSQSIMFDKEKWSLDEVQIWINENSDLLLKSNFAKLFSVKGVEVFSAGTWNGETYTKEDIDGMVKAFDETSKTCRPYLKLGHNEKQKLLQKDGLPAAGWIGKLYRKGEKLLADFVDMPKKIYELVENGAYRNVSSEIYWDIDICGRKYKRLLSAVALLGADMPAVGSLSDILSLYSKEKAHEGFFKNQNDLIMMTYSLSDKSEGLEMPKENEQELADLKKYKLDNEANKADEKKELDGLKQYKLDQETKKVEDQKKYTKLKNEKFIGELENKSLVTPAMRPYILALLGEDKKEYSFKQEKEDKEETFTKEALIKKLFSLKSKSDVNFDEDSTEGDERSNKSEDVFEAKIAKYAKDNNVDYVEAYKIVMNEESESKE